MIIKGLLELIFVLLKIVFAPINLPQLPDSVMVVIDDFMGVLKSAVGLLSIIVDFSVVKYLIPFAIVIINFDRLYRLIMFILRKIPFMGIK